jgi:hypothetical protein
VRGLLLAGAEQPGDFLQVDLAVGVQADRHRVLGGVRAQARCPRGDGAFGEDGGLAGGAGFRVVQLEPIHRRGVRVLAEAALRWADPGQPLLAGVRIDAAGAAGGDPVDRPEAG